MVDLGFTAIAMTLTGGISSPFFLIFLWIMIGYSTRYGRDMLWPVTSLAAVAFTLVVWHSGLTNLQPEVVMQYLALIALPAYLQSLLAAVTRAQTEADQANRAKSRFLARMSHEIRTPLAALIGTTELLHHTRLTPQQQTYAANLKTSANALRSLVDDILDFSKIEAGRLILEHRAFDPNCVIDEVMGVMSPLAADKGLTLQSHIDPALPTAVIGDPDRLRQVLFNLVGNAVKFTEQGEVVIRARPMATASQDRTLIRMEVSDTGIGIPPDQLQSIFDSFKQVHSDRGVIGTGLGTTISRELVKIMGGQIGVESTPEVGSTFWFEVPWPMADPKVPASRSTAHPIGTDQAPVPVTALPVLVAEDDPINASVVSSLLSGAGHQVDVVVDGSQALEALRQRVYGVAFIDRRMPGLSGIEVARQWRAIEPEGRHLPLIALTADATVEDEQESREAGFDEFLIKPASPERLIAMATKYAWASHSERVAWETEQE